MKTQLLLIALLSLSGLYLFTENSDSSFLQPTKDDQMNVFKAFQSWKSEFNQNYNTGEETYRFEQFQKNYKFVQEHNAKGDQLVLGLTYFAAMSNEEYVQKILLKNRNQQISNEINYSTVPKSENVSIDWKAKGAVLPTPTQGHCGSCWAFSSIGALQGLHYIVDGVLERLSAQQLVSCMPPYGLDPKAENGCDGSESQFAYRYTHEHGIESWAEYPYVSGEKGVVPACHHKDSDSVFWNKGDKPGDNGLYRIKRGDVAEMKKRIQQQPISVAVKASSIYFSLYQSGILNTNHCEGELNHEILMYGMHDVEGEQAYWMVQNSWGPDRWGTGGYGKIAISEGDGVCGINMDNAVPLSVNQKP